MSGEKDKSIQSANVLTVEKVFSGIASFLQALWDYVMIRIFLALTMVILGFLTVWMLALSHRGRAGPASAILFILLGSTAYTLATWCANTIAKYRKPGSRALLTSLGMFILAAVLILQLGFIIYAGRNSWHVRDARSCAASSPTSAIKLNTCKPTTRWDTSMLVAWHLVDAAPLANVTELTKWSPPAVYGSSWVGILLVYAEALFIFPIVVLIRDVWQMITRGEQSS